jgi:tRNA(Ile)-lysidine synthase
VHRLESSGILGALEVKATATVDRVTERVTEISSRTIKRYRMIRRGDLVICAVSGGPDSMCLLSVLARLKEELGISLHVVHLNHHMREEASKDAAMVERFAQSLGIPCTVGHADVFAIAKEKRVGEEEAGRMARYALFRKVKDEIGASKVALGHNLNDQAETVLMRLLRGSGARGLAGIPPVYGDTIRPLLEVGRSDIEAYCRENQIPTMSDTYNYDMAYTRNLLRHRVMPQLADRFNPSLVKTLAATGLILRWDADYLDADAERRFLSCSYTEGRVTSIDDAVLEGMHPAVASRVLERAWRECADPSEDSMSPRVLEMRHILSLMEGKHSQITLPLGVTASREDGYLRFYPSPPKVDVTLDSPHDLAGTEVWIPGLGLTVSLKVLGSEETSKVACDPGKAAPRASRPHWLMVEPVVHLDYNRCTWPLRIRTRMDGDRFAPLGMQGKEQKLKDFFISNRVPRLYRDFVPLLVSGDDIIWVGGFRLSEKYRIQPESSRILRAEVRPRLRYRENCAIIC